MPGSAGVTHDISIEDTTYPTSGVKRGFMLYQGRERRRPHRVTDARTISPRIISSAAALRNATNLGEFSLNYAQYWTQDDWRGGVGGMLARRNPNRLTGAIVDVTSDGRLIAPRAIIVPTFDTTPTETLPTGFATQGSEVWAFVGRDIYRWNYSDKEWDIGTRPTPSANPALDMFRNGVEFGARTIVPAWLQASQEPARYIYKSAPGVNWTRIDSSGNNSSVNSPKYLAVANGVLWGGYWANSADGTTNRHMVRSTADPTSSANWNSLDPVGTADADITNLVDLGNALLVCKTDGVWAYTNINSAGSVLPTNLTPEFRRMRHPDHFRAAHAWNGHVLLSIGWGGLRDLWEGVLYDISFKNTLPGFPQLWGKVLAISSDADQVYMLVQNWTERGNPSTLWLLRGIFAGFENEAPAWRWYLQARFDMKDTINEYSTSIFAEGILSGTKIHRRCWMGFGQMDHGTLIDPRPRFFPQDEDVEDEYRTSGTAITTIFDANTPGIDKIFLDIVFNTRNVNAERTIRISHRVNARPEAPIEPFLPSWISGPSNIMTTDDATYTLPIGTTGKNIQFALNIGAEKTTTSEIIEVKLRYYLKPPRSETFPLRLYLADGQELLNGTSGGSPKGDLAQIRTWAGTAQQVRLTDAERNVQTVIFVPGSLSVTELAKEPGRRSEYLVELLAVEV